MEYSKEFLSELFDNMINGFAYHKIIKDDSGKPVNYEFLDVNKAYERIIGMNREDIIGKTILDILPDIKNDSFDWIGFYGEVASEGTIPNTEQYSEAIHKWLLVNSFSPKPDYFVSVVVDITDEKIRDIYITNKNNELAQLYEELLESDQKINRHIKELEIFHQNAIENDIRADIAQKIAHIGHWDYDIRTKTFWGSEGAFRLFGIERINPSFQSDKIKERIIDFDWNKLKEAINNLINNKKKVDIEFQIIRASDNERRRIHAVGELLISAEGRIIKIVGALQDITEQVEYMTTLKEKNEELMALNSEIYKRGEELKEQINEINRHKELLAISETRYRVLVDNALDAIFSFDLEGVITAVNSSFCKMFHLEKEDLIGEKILKLVSLLDYSENDWKLKISRILATKKAFSYEHKYRLLGEERFQHISLAPVLDSNRNLISVNGTSHDITDLKLNEERIKHMAYHDMLTNLPNRIMFFDRLGNAISQAKRTREKIAVLFFDMDNFKRINDTLGHTAGDQLLIETGKRINSCLREYDTVARLSGDEFAVILQNVEREENLMAIVYRIQQKFSMPFPIGENNVDLSSSIGIALYPEDGDTPEELLKNADTAMYKAKELGKNKSLFFHFTMKDDVIRKLRIERLLKKAIKHKEFVLYYQPQFATETLDIRGFEALIRWESPELGFTSPNEFIRIAEDNGQILDIGEWIIQEACYMLKQLNKMFDKSFIMSINISLLQLRQNNFDKKVLNFVHFNNLKPENIELEITESHFIDNDDVAIAIIERLMKHGFKIALDDFGTGYSSLSYLKKIPMNLLKIDQAFVREIDPDKPEHDLTEPIISLVHKLGIQTMAEGVESEEQFKYLANAKCDYLQGFYFGRPIPGNQIEEFINNYNQKRHD